MKTYRAWKCASMLGIMGMHLSYMEEAGLMISQSGLLMTVTYDRDMAGS